MKFVKELPNGAMQWVDVTGYRVATDADISKQQNNIAISKLQRQILQIKRKFDDCKYLQEKYVDGALTEEEYAPIRAERESWRVEIRRLEAEIEKLK